MMRFATPTFVKGLIVVLPIVAAFYVLIWLVGRSEALVEGLRLAVVPDHYYVPGPGVGLLLAAVFCVGLLTYPWITRKLLDGVDGVLRRTPLFGAIYSPARDLMEVLGGDVEQKLGQVVLVKTPNTNMGNTSAV